MLSGQAARSGVCICHASKECYLFEASRCTQHAANGLLRLCKDPQAALVFAGSASSWSANQNKFSYAKGQGQNHAWQEEVAIG